WSAVVAAKTSNSPCAVVHGQRVISRSVAAMHYGVQVGMRRRHAQGLCPDLEIAAYQPDRDRRAFNTVVRTVNELVPLIEVSEPGVIVFATRGPSRYFGGDEPMANKIFQALRGSIIADAQFGIGVADSRLAAHIAAHISAQHKTKSTAKTPFIVEPDQTKVWLGQQSVRVLSEFASVDRETVSLLERLGLNTLQDVCKLGESMLAGRFGELGVELHRLARGDEQHPLAAVAPPPEHLCSRTFEEPVVDQQTLLNNVRAMAEEFSEYFVKHGAICVRLILKFESETGAHSERLWYRPQGLTARAITESAKWQIESWSNKSALARVQLIADEVRTDTARQLKLWGGVTQVDETASRAIGRLTELLGSTAVQIVKRQGGRDLQDDFQLVSVSHFRPTQNESNASTKKPKWRGSLPTPSPSVVYSEPLLVQVVDENKNLVRVSARHQLSAEPTQLIINQQSHKIVSWAGPWPIEEKWWDTARSRRLVRLQVVVEKSSPDGSQQVQALLVTLEHGEWSIAAIYG
ncbi:MAG: DNA polymerase Y family protein, partial [Actinobacteria bacterium]|nr:DNA polymerase Y family protein [Actinomycetota bacterium]